MTWHKGLKTTYYLRSLGATRIEKSTLDVNRYGDALGRKKKVLDAAVPEESNVPPSTEASEPKICKLNTTGGPDEDCEACQ